MIGLIVPIVIIFVVPFIHALVKKSNNIKSKNFKLEYFIVRPHRGATITVAVCSILICILLLIVIVAFFFVNLMYGFISLGLIPIILFFTKLALGLINYKMIFEGTKITINRILFGKKEITLENIDHAKIITNDDLGFSKIEALRFYSKDGKKLLASTNLYTCYDLLKSFIKKHHLKIKYA